MTTAPHICPSCAHDADLPPVPVTETVRGGRRLAPAPLCAGCGHGQHTGPCLVLHRPTADLHGPVPCDCGQTPAPQPETCRHCGREVEDRGDPSMDGRHAARWVHVPGGYRICYPQVPGSPWAEPAPQPETAPDTEVAHVVAAAIHGQMPGCTHDEHGADGVTLATTVLDALTALGQEIGGDDGHNPLDRAHVASCASCAESMCDHPNGFGPNGCAGCGASRDDHE